MIRPILIHPDPRLKKICAPVKRVDDALRALIDGMFETMYAAPGIGLAAPQVGVIRRVLVMDCAKDDATPAPLALVNPQITWADGEQSTYEEGCLSIPEQYGEVTRPATVKVKYLNYAGEVEERHFAGLQATCAQHEIDHLDGKLFIDYLGPVRRQMITQKMKKYKRDRAKEKSAAPN